MAIPSFDLLDVLKAMQKQRRFIIAIVAISMALAGGLWAVKRKKYKATAHFLVNNPIYADRGNLFRFTDTRFVDYFGGDDDLDKVTALALSDTVTDNVIRNADFHIIYNMDVNKPQDHAALMDIFKKNFNIKRSEYKDIEVSYIAYDAQTAANVTNTCVDMLEKSYRHYYQSMKADIAASLTTKLLDVNRAIDSLTDTLSAMREQYGIYSILSPNRQNMISGDVKGGKGMGRAIEEIQNIESIKDQLVTDRAQYISRLNEFSVSANQSMSLLKVITRAVAPINPSGPGIGLIVLIAGLLSFFFSVLWVLVRAYSRKLNEAIK